MWPVAGLAAAAAVPCAAYLCLSRLLAPPPTSFAGRFVLVTGGSSGLGRSLAVEFSRRGASVVVGGRNKHELANTVQLCRVASTDPKCVFDFVCCDLTTPSNGAFLAREAAAKMGGRLDVLCLNAGMSACSKFDEITDLSFMDGLLSVAYTSAVHTVHAAIPFLEAARTAGIRPAILATSSVQAGVGCGAPMFSMDGPPKYALNGFLEAIRIEWPHTTVTIACPGFIDTPLLSRTVGPAGRDVYAPDRSQASPPGIIAHRMADSLARQHRVVYFSTLDWFGHYARNFIPGVIDKIARHEVESATRQRNIEKVSPGHQPSKQE